MILPRSSSRRPKGFALAITLVLLSLAMSTLAAVLFYCQASGILAMRSVDLSESLGAAEASTELVISQMQQDFRNGGHAAVSANLATYQALTPAAAAVPAWDGFQFMTPGGVSGNLVEQRTAWNYGVLPWRYGGVGSFAVYRVISNVRRPWMNNTADTTNSVVGAWMSEVMVAEIPLFTFSYFYNLDLELHPWHNWTVNGRLHSNRTNYFKPTSGATLTFTESVTAAGRIVHDDHPDDPEWRSSGTISYSAARDNKSEAGSISLPFGPYDSFGGHQLIDIPDVGTPAAVAAACYYNKAHLRIITQNSGYVIADTTGAGYPAALTNALRTVTFFDRRENQNVQCTELSLDAFYNAYSSAGMPPPTIVFMADLRSLPSDTIPGVKLRRGSTLAADLTVSTPQPLYVKGHFNTTNPKLASVACDAITLLSRNWNDSDGFGAGDLSTRNADSTTYNLAVITGIVPTRPGESSGGILNVLRLLENWNGDTLTYRGSIAVPYESEIATETWQNIVGTAYGAPSSRVLSFETAFTNSAALNVPPGCPMALTVSRLRPGPIAPGVNP